MSMKLCLVVILLELTLDFSDCQLLGYTYLEKTGSFYKYNCDNVSWRTADQFCKLDGTLLYYPENEAELEEVNSVIAEGSAWIGVSKKAGSFQTVDGRNTSNIFMPWASDEPKNKNMFGESCECVSLSYKSYKKISSEPCANNDSSTLHYKSFICKFTPKDNAEEIDSEVETVETTTEIVNQNPPLLKEYKYLENTTSFYKFHKPAVSWYEAVELCKSDGAQLFYPENENEAKGVAKLLGIWETLVIIPVWIGITNLNSSKKLFEPIDGRRMGEVYHRWNPFDYETYNYYHCVQMDHSYFLYQFDCDQPRRAVCKYSRKNNQVDGRPQGGGNCSSPSEQDESKERNYFGKVVEDEIRQFPNKEKLQVMASILRVIREQWGTKRDG